MIALATYEEGGPDEGPERAGVEHVPDRAPGADEDADPAGAGAARPSGAFLEELGLDLLAAWSWVLAFPAQAVGADAVPCALGGACARSAAACKALLSACGRRRPAQPG